MPDLSHTLQGHDLGFLKMIANAWGLELLAPDARHAQQELLLALLKANLVREVVEALPAEVRAALQTLLENDGRLPWPVFTRRFGEVRSMGAARRDRERPDLNPISPAEWLWYRALIGRNFLDPPPATQEYAYIPDDLLALLRPLYAPHNLSLGRPATPAESAHPLPADDSILDQACTLLAALRLNLEPPTLPDMPSIALQTLLHSAGLLDEQNQPNPEAVRAFLEAKRGIALSQLVQAWMNSSDFNELLLLPGLRAEGNWRNNPLHTRHTVLGWISQLPSDTWWSLSAFIAAIHKYQPDFQRPAGDYDSWFLWHEQSGQFLRGFASWEAVEGALLRYFVCGPMHWLGLLDLSAPAPNAAPTAFRRSAWAEALWHGQSPPLPEEEGELSILSDGKIRLAPRAPRALRYQIARSCAWLSNEGGSYTYQITPAALERAARQGLKPSHLLNLLRRHSSTALPPSVLHAIERWEAHGCQAHIQSVSLLRVQTPEILAALRKTRAARYLGESLTPTVVLLKPGSDEIVQHALLEIGYLGEIKTSDQPAV
ncbi:MAG: helicase-associated domain-containing protein [Anaerolinea sp.]|nr:helicase-associated domain-containing protein [Anaerolinea sp.]